MAYSRIMETRQVTPTAKRNSYRVAILVGVLTQGSVLHPATLGWGNATPSELPGVCGEAPPQALPKGRESYLAVG